MDKKYVTGQKAMEHFGVSASTLRRWTKEGRIDFIFAPSGKRIYNIEGFHQNSLPNPEQRKTLLYIRVSSEEDRKGLEDQRTELLKLYPGSRVYQDVGSGLTIDRPGLLSVLEFIKGGGIQRLAVTSSDRLSRNSINFIEWYCRTYDCKLVVLNKEDQSSRAELEEELYSFVKSLHRQRRKKRSDEDDKDQVKSNASSEGSVKEG